jgi:hypothetical protein
MCCPGKSWCLTGAGKALAMNGQPLIDDTGRDILTIIARAPVRQLALARRLGVCSLTAKRRLGLMIGQGLIDVNASRFRITDQGRSLLGDQCPSPWLRPEAISAAMARDVVRRQHGLRCDGEVEVEAPSPVERRQRESKWDRLAVA